MKKAVFVAAICTAFTSQAAIWQLDLGPEVGGFGLNEANERPTPTGSSATGKEIVDFDGSGKFIEYDDVTKTMELHFGWGQFQDVGGVNLSSAMSGLHIHGPADVNNTATILYDLTSAGTGVDFVDWSSGGYLTATWDGQLELVEGQGGFTIAQQEAQLLGNEWYINVHSANFSNGEIRGQLLNVVPEPEHYAAFAGLALLGFAGYRRFKAAPAA